MEELFGVPMNLIMAFLLAIFLLALAVVTLLGWRNPIMLKIALRNIPRRRAQSVLIIVGIMLSSVIMATAFGTGDTITHTKLCGTQSNPRSIDGRVITQVRFSFRAWITYFCCCFVIEG